MMQNVPPLEDVGPIVDAADLDTETIAEAAPERLAAIWASRITGVVGILFLAAALVTWFARHGHYRLVLALLIVAMFAAILHSYTFDDRT
jgi:hypothetical protein